MEDELHIWGYVEYEHFTKLFLSKKFMDIQFNKRPNYTNKFYERSEILIT